MEDAVSAARGRMKRSLSYQVENMQGVGTRQGQEDSFAFVHSMDVTEMREKGLLAVVADGMGGMQGGKEGSERAVFTLRRDFEGFDMKGDIRTQLLQSVLDANKQVFSLLHGKGGSTVVVCLFFQEQLYFCSVGDSYLFLVRDEELIQLNRLQNQRSEMYLDRIYEGGMDPSGIRESREGAVLTQFVGMKGLEDIDHFALPLRLRDGDVVILCSDGVGGVLSEEEILRCTAGSATEICKALEEMIFQKRKPHQDNYTALVVRCLS